jgi:O-antigen/teichoic acid export membrane protein
MWITQGTGPLFWISAVYGSYFLLQATDIVEFGRRVDGDFAGIARLRLSASLLSGGLKLALAELGFPLITIAYAMIAEYLIATLYYVLRIKGTLNWRKAHWRSPYAKSLLRRATLLVIAGALGTLQSRIDSLLIQRFLGLDALGQYASALRMVELFDAFGIVLSILFIPEFGRRKGLELDRYAKKAYLGSILLFMLALPGLYLLCALFPLVYGSAYSEGQNIMPWLFPRPFLYLIGSIRMGLLLAEQYYRLIPLYAACAVVTTLILFKPMTNQYGLEGAAMAGTLGVLISSFGLDAFINQRNLQRLLLSPLALPDLIKGARRFGPTPHR